MSILFKGDNKALISSITALLALDAKGALSPHGIGEMARDLLETCAARLPAEQHHGVQVASVPVDRCYDVRAKMIIAFNEAKKGGADLDDCLDSAYKAALRFSPNPQASAANPAEVEALRGAYLRAGDREHELRKELAQLRAALKFYADSDHYSTDDGLNWDSCSGEPANILWHESEPWFIEDGSIVRAALSASAEPTVTCTGDDITEGRDLLGKGLGRIIESTVVQQQPPKSECPTCLGDRMFGCTQCQPDELCDLATWKRRAIEAESKLRTYDPQVVDSVSEP